MSLDWRVPVILAAIRRQNPALPPRWSKAAAAVRLALISRASDGKDFDRVLAAIALDTRSHGPLSNAMRAVAERAALEAFEPWPFRIARLMTVRFFRIALAIDAALNGGETSAWTCFANALNAGEISPDKGEVWAAIRRLPIPGRDLDTLQREHTWLFNGDDNLTAAADRAIAAAAKAEAAAAEAAEPVPAEAAGDTTPRGH
jgi:hypothetical protein